MFCKCGSPVAFTVCIGVDAGALCGVGAGVGCGVGTRLQIVCESVDEGPQLEQELKKINGVPPGV